MSDMLILEFAEGTSDQYAAVNKILGVDATTGTGDYPAPLESHSASHGDDGLIVVEIWESQAAQAQFMDRLGPALAEAGVPAPTRTTWQPLVGHYHA
jgi:hypothetical protein